MTITIRTLTAHDTDALEQVRQYFRNYAGWLGVDLSYQNFGEEMATLPGAYAAPQGRLFFAEVDGQPAGCVGIRPMTEGSEGMCEMKRLYVDPAQRAKGVGHKLALAGIRAAKEIGYRKLVVDTLPAMRMAVKLYRELGFLDTPAYYKTSVEGEMFLALDLANWSEEEVLKENLSHLFDFNRAWSKQMQEVDPGYFTKLSTLQSPELLWIGCSDSRVPANEIVGLLPGEVFVHRNVANVVVHTDLNCLSVIQFAVEVLKVKHIMVVGHYGCGGVKAALNGDRVGLVDIWLRHVRDVREKHLAAIESLPHEVRHDRLCELNVLEQVANVCQTYVVQDAWTRGQPLTVHGWIYGLKDGLMTDLGFTVHRAEDLGPRYLGALQALEPAKS
ncbi:MAG TPA: carbonate dehydratase [Rhodocyclaceae bacterium]|nr:carbonate dehydratase [Rhodocyclaceae bacterium]